MKNKILIFNVTIVTLSLLVIFFSGLSVNKKSHREEAEKNIVAVTHIYKENYNDNITKNVPENVRVTVISEDKTVIADSEDQSIVGKPHENREEITAAWEGDPKVVTRKSQTLGKELVYYAEKVETQSGFVIVRTSIPVESVDAYVKNTIPTMIYVLISSLFVSYIASVLAANGIIKPLENVKKKLAAVNDGTYSGDVELSGDKDVDAILSEIDELGGKLKSSIDETNAEKERLDYILGNISDGIIVIDEHGTVGVMNKVARGVFGGDGFIGRNYSVLSADEGLMNAISSAIGNKTASEYEFENDGRIYLTSVNSLENGYTVIVMSDITEMRNGEKMRGEFFANASHELKTPLTAIRGFNDLIAMKTSDEEIKGFTVKTDKELTRILALISDMLDLSKLEANKVSVKEKLDLRAVAKEVESSLAGLAEKKKVTVTVDGQGFVEMEKEHAVELIKNLVENGIRYNNEGGFVKVKISREAGKVRLSVEDNGIGIEDECQPRIFERFYRVNKSRSRETGGTGLGLAIVKHICALYKADIDLKSKYGAGTTITVTVGAA